MPSVKKYKRKAHDEKEDPELEGKLKASSSLLSSRDAAVLASGADDE